MEEIWKNIEGYEGLYQVSNLGRVKSLIKHNGTNERILKPAMNKDGYLQVNLHKDAKQKMYRVHRLVAQAFIENNDLFKIEVNHIDEDKTNNFVFINEDGSVDLDKSNLEWCTRKYNINHGTHNERMAKSQSKQVSQFSLDGEFIKTWQSTMEIQRVLGFSQGNISQSCNGKCSQMYGYIWKYGNSNC